MELRQIKKILVGTGLTGESVGAVLQARAMADAYGAELHAVHAIEPISSRQEEAMPGLAEKHAAQAREELEKFASTHELVDHATLHVVRGSPETEILKLRASLKADLLVVGRYGKGGLKRGILGSIADRLVRKCPVPALVVQPEFRGTYSTIGVASDLDQDSEVELRRAIDVARAVKADKVRLIHTFAVPAGYHMVSTWDEACARLARVGEERATELIERVGGDIPVEVHIHEGAPATQVTKVATDLGVDLLALSTHHRSITSFSNHGRTTEKILRNSDCSVWCESNPALYQGLIDSIRELLD
ncbi:MAG: universal stress protein [Phycisphaerales bacterium]|nr:universal stress protein [Phycisphaerales bacterium]